jgi:alpha-galactosidase
MKQKLALLCLILLAISKLCPAAEPVNFPNHQTRVIEGWTLYINEQLLEQDATATQRALELLTRQLQEIVQGLPSEAVVELRKVPLWFSPEYAGVQPRAEYHPGAAWLKDNGRDPAMEKAVEFTNVRIFERESLRMPNFALHELAHAYHDRVLSGGFKNRDVKTAFEQAKTNGMYAEVEQRFGDGRSATVQAYAMTNPMEYFAECSEAFFSTNDFFPFTRKQLAQHDPAMFALLKTLWREPAQPTQAIKVFILAGQSNMEGHGFIAANGERNGGKGSLEFLVKDLATSARFSHLVDPVNGQWRTRSDVAITYLDRQGPLTVGYGARPELIGPELGFGWVIGEWSEEPVLLIKCAWGGKSLAVDFRPPSAGAIPYSLGEKQDAAIAQDPEIVGHYYRETIKLTKSALARLNEFFPESEGKYIIQGFGWHQGWNDRINDQFNAEYESNMAHFIQDVRQELGTPRLPFVIAETGMTGPDESHPRALSLMKAQAAVAERPEFQGNVAFVGTKNFWRDKEASPTGQGYHWNSNAETYYLIGQAMAEAMKRL